MPGLADQIHDCPMPLTDLDLIQFQTDQFRSAKTTPKEHRQHGVVSLGPHSGARSTLQNRGTLRRAQPIAGAKPKLLDALHSANPGSKFRAEQTGVGSFVCESSNCRKLLVDGVCGQTTGFQVHAVPNHDDAVEGEARFGTVPGNELIDGILVHSARAWRTEAVENGPLTMIQIRQSKGPATVVRLNFWLAHGDGLLMPRQGITVD